MFVIDTCPVMMYEDLSGKLVNRESEVSALKVSCTQNLGLIKDAGYKEWFFRQLGFQVKEMMYQVMCKCISMDFQNIIFDKPIREEHTGSFPNERTVTITLPFKLIGAMPKQILEIDEWRKNYRFENSGG